jgi:DNA polymerase-1
MISGFYRAYSYITPWKEQELEFARTNGFVFTRLGRKRHLPELRDPNAEWGVRSYAERQAINVEIQGDVADWMRAVMPTVDEYVESIGGWFIGQVHDSLMFELPEEIAVEGAKRIKYLMETGMILSIPMKADVAIGPNWGDAEKLAA